MKKVLFVVSFLQAAVAAAGGVPGNKYQLRDREEVRDSAVRRDQRSLSAWSGWDCGPSH